MMSTDQTNSERCGCDGDPHDGLVSIDEAIARGLALVRAVVESESVPLWSAIGRVLAETVRSPLPLPPFDGSAMDGYALATGDLAGEGPWLLPVCGRIEAGAAALPALSPGAAIRIFTGGRVPAACDAVVMQERVTRGGDAIRLDHRPLPDQNIRRRGEDVALGAEILAAGRTIGPREAAALAAIGAAEVPVRRKVRIAFFCSGNELVQPGTPLGPAQIYNSNRFALLAALALPWIEARDLGAVPDDPAAITEALTSAAAWADLIISTGGVSVGDEDHLPRLVRAAGGVLSVEKIAMRPGKPLVLGRLGGAVYLGLPGNPVASHVGWTLIGARLAERLGGLTARPRGKLVVKTDFALDRRPGRCEFRPARIVGYDAAGASVVTIKPGGFSARIGDLAAADGLVMIPADEERVEIGMLLEFLPF